MELEKDILVLNIVTNFHKVVIKITGIRDQTPSKMVNFHEQRATTTEGFVGHESFSNLNKTLWY